jgi:transketolase
MIEILYAITPNFEKVLVNEFIQLLKKAKLRLLRLHFEHKIGHIGGNLSALDFMLFIYTHMNQSDDAFVLSKGHSAGALYVALWATGQLSEKDLATFHKDGSKLAGHPIANWHPNIHFSTGSLGHGFGLAAGVALAKKLEGDKGKVYCLLSDGEWQEGSNWEALIFSTHHKLSNLTLFIDLNGLQGFGSTTEIASLEALADKIRSFDVDLIEINGHDIEAISSAFHSNHNRLKVVVMNTVKGKGVSFMENRMEWHYLPLNQEQYIQAQEEVDI